MASARSGPSTARPPAYGGDRLLKDEPVAGSHSQDLYLLSDGIVGSITDVASPNGAVSNLFQYDAFGDRIVNFASTAYSYAGQEHDAGTGLIYLRARYYDPSLGRFISADPFWGRLEEPASQNRYVYGHNNPLIYTDPLGLAVGDWWDYQANTQRAREIAQELLADPMFQGHNDISDARRHAEWNRRMTEEIGSSWAFIIGTGHELWDNAYEQQYKQGLPIEWPEIFMDLHNNAVGRSAGRSGLQIEDKDLKVLNGGSLYQMNSGGASYGGGGLYPVLGGGICVY